MRGFPNRRGLLASGIGLTYWLYYLVLFCGPLVLLVIASLRRYSFGLPEPRLSLDNYRTILQAGPFPLAVLRSGLLSAAVSSLCVFIGTATVLGAFGARRLWVRNGVLFFCGLMFFAGTIPRVFALEFMLSGNGLLGAVAPSLHGTSGLLYSIPGVLVAYLPLMLPLTTVALYVARSAISDDVLDAATDLGSGWWKTQVRVVVPMMAPGLIVAIVLSFVMTLADVVVVDLVGGARVYTGGMVILDFVRIDDWGRASAAAVVLLVVAVSVAALSTVTLSRDNQRHR